jgi:hypothetical protein
LAHQRPVRRRRRPQNNDHQHVRPSAPPLLSPLSLSLTPSSLLSPLLGCSLLRVAPCALCIHVYVYVTYIYTPHTMHLLLSYFNTHNPAASSPSQVAAMQSKSKPEGGGGRGARLPAGGRHWGASWRMAAWAMGHGGPCHHMPHAMCHAGDRWYKINYDTPGSPQRRSSGPPGAAMRARG